jgi:hypothetical protein
VVLQLQPTAVGTAVRSEDHQLQVGGTLIST